MVTKLDSFKFRAAGAPTPLGAVTKVELLIVRVQADPVKAWIESAVTPPIGVETSERPDFASVIVKTR